MANTQIAISKNGKTTLATAGKYCERNIDINVAVANVADDVPAYVKAEADSIAAKVVAAQGSRVFTLAAITDLHYGNGSYTDGIIHASQALAYISKQITLDAFAVLGDYTDGYPIDDVDNAFSDCRKINSLLASMESVPNLRMQGNHDFYAGYDQFVHYNIQAYSEGVTWGDKIGGYFYRDFTDKKMRIICVNTTETDNANIGVSTTQYAWFVNALDLSAKSDAASWSILVLSHHPLDWYVSDSTYRFAYIMQGYKDGASGTVGGVSYNFAGKNSATLIGNIHGHIHNLLTGYVNKGNVNTSNPTKVLRICTPEACIGRANQYDGAWKEATTYAKTINSAKDTSFVVYCIDLDAQSIKAFCYGAGYDREISYAPIPPKTYSITHSLTQCTASGATSITEEGTATVIIAANGGYELPDIITVSGASYTWDKSTGAVVLSNPTGDVTITVIAKAKYKNQIPLSINSDGSQYVGTNGEDGYKSGYRLNSSGAEADATGIAVTGFIPVKAGDVIYLKNIKASLTATGGTSEHTYLALYNSAFEKTASRKFNNIGSNLSSLTYVYDSFTTGADGYVSSFRITDTYNNLVSSGGYMRISAEGLDGNSIITVNEEITDNQVGASYANLIPQSINADGTLYNGGQGWKDGYRLNSSGTETAQSGIAVTGFMPVKGEQTIYGSAGALSGTAGNCYVTLYDSSFELLKGYNMSSSALPSIPSFSGNSDGSFEYTITKNNYLASTVVENTAYFRMSSAGIRNGNVIVTVNEPIE